MPTSPTRSGRYGGRTAEERRTDRRARLLAAGGAAAIRWPGGREDQA